MQYYIHFDPATQAPGFYCDAIHGSRTLWVVDPDWQRPLITVTLQPGETAPDGSQLKETDEPTTLDLPDDAAEHPLIEVPNPDCLLPADAVEITTERYSELLAGTGQGLLIVADENGQPTLQTPPPPTTDQLIAQAVAQRTLLLQQATQAIAPLQDAIDLDEATDAEAAALISWKRYRVHLSRIEQQAGYPQSIEWPASPADAP